MHICDCANLIINLLHIRSNALACLWKTITLLFIVIRPVGIVDQFLFSMSTLLSIFFVFFPLDKHDLTSLNSIAVKRLSVVEAVGETVRAIC